MNKQILNDSTEDFILKYRAALKSKFTKEQLSNYLGILPKSIDRRRQKIYKNTGLELPQLPKVKNTTTTQSYETVLYDMAEQFGKSNAVNTNVKQITDIRQNSRYVITAAQNATPINDAFLESLKIYCEHNNATLMIIPYRYKNPTSVWQTNDKSHDWWHPALREYLIDDELKVGKDIRIMGNIKIQPTASNPLSGFDTITGLDSAIFGHPNVELKVVPSAPTKFPKILATTGAITVPNYTDSKAGHKGAYHHEYSAVIVEIDTDETFHIRHITSSSTGEFYDLDKLYTPNGATSNHRALALVAGDLHSEVVDTTAFTSIFIDNSIAETVSPEVFVFHDVLDFSVRSHHNIRDSIGRYRKHLLGDNNNVEEALQKMADLLYWVSECNPLSKNYVVKSNHDEHISRWLKEADPNIDPENAKFYHYLKYHQYDAVSKGEAFDPIEFWCQHPDEEDGMDARTFSVTKFLNRHDNLEIGNIELSLHGDMGPNGARGSLKNLSRLGQRVIIGHSHTPGISNGSYQVGTTSKLKLEYNNGPSSWLHTCAIIYPNGTVTLINVINGKWRI